MNLKIALLIILAYFTTSMAQASVWTSTQSWSPHVEQVYQDWVRTTWTKDIFKQAGPLQDVKLDCADAVISMRLLFAYENKLPFAVKDPSSNRAITNDMARFDKVAGDDARFRAFAIFLYNVLDTPELPLNSYPVAMNRAAIHAGVFLRTDKASHHSWTVKDLDRAGIPFLLYASRPAKTVLLDRHYYPTMGFLWGQQDANGNQIDANLQTPGDVESGVGFRMFRYPEDILKPVWQVPGYSLDQYQMNRISWARTLQRSLQITQESPDESATRLIGETCKEATDRISAVADAVNAMKTMGPYDCFNAQQYDDYSTPSRDSRAVGVFRDLIRTFNANAAALSPSVRAQAEAIVSNRDPGTFCSLKIGSGTRLTLGEAVSLGVSGSWSSNPNDTLLARWGRERSPTSRAANCPTY